jgi:hypothetical protein
MTFALCSSCIRTTAALNGSEVLLRGGSQNLFPSSSFFVGVLIPPDSFVSAEWDGRIQKIGCHYRMFERRSANWKGNVGTSQVTEVPITDEYRRWVDLAANAIGEGRATLHTPVF